MPELPKPPYVDLANEIATKTGAKLVFVLVHEGNEGNGVCLHARTSEGADFIQDAVEAQYVAEMLRDTADRLSAKALDYIGKARERGQSPTEQQLARAFPKKSQA